MDAISLVLITLAILAFVIFICVLSFKNQNCKLLKILYAILIGVCIIGAIIISVFAFSLYTFNFFNEPPYSLTFNNCLTITTWLVSFLGSTTIGSITVIYNNKKNSSRNKELKGEANED